MANKNFYTQFTNRRLLIGADGKNRTFWRSGKEFYTVFLQENAEEHKKYAELGEMGHIYNIRREKEKGKRAVREGGRMRNKKTLL